MCLHNIDVNICRGRAVTNVGRTCGPTPLLEFIDAIKYVYTILAEISVYSVDYCVYITD